MSAARHRRGGATQGVAALVGRPRLLAALLVIAVVSAVGGLAVWQLSNDPETIDQASSASVTPGELASAGECSDPSELTVAVADSYPGVLAAVTENLGPEAPCVSARMVPASGVGGEGQPQVEDIDAVVDATVDGRKNGATGALQGVTTAEPEVFARTVTTVAMPRPMAEAIGWPERQQTWDDLKRLVADPQAWVTAGRPQFGDFAVSVADPSTSPAALAGMLGLASAASDTPIPDLSPSDMDSKPVQRVLLALDRQVTRRAADQKQLVNALRAANRSSDLMATTSMALVDEQAVWDFNNSTPDVPMVALYPPDGVLPVELTYAAVASSDQDQARAEAAAAFGRYLRTGDGQQAVTSVGLRDVAESASPALTETLGVSPGGTAGATSAPSSDAVAALSEAWKRLQNPGRYLVAIDVSGSMRHEVPGTGRTKLQFAQDAAIEGMRLVPDSAEIGLWEFSTTLRGTQDYRELVPVGRVDAQINGRTRRDSLIAAVRGLTPREDTGLFDTALAAFRSAKRDYQPGEPNIVVLLTDGRNDDPASVGLGPLIAAFRAEQDSDRPVRFLTIAYGKDADTASLKRIADATGGSAYSSPNPANIGRVFFEALSGS